MSELYLECSPEFKNGLGVDFGAIWSILEVRNGSQIANFDQKMRVFKAIFAPRRPLIGLRGPK